MVQFRLSSIETTRIVIEIYATFQNLDVIDHVSTKLVLLAQFCSS